MVGVAMIMMMMIILMVMMMMMTLLVVVVAVMMMVMVMASPEADQREVAITDYHTALLGPWTDRITQQGGVRKAEDQ
jgi:hypothetical protein